MTGWGAVGVRAAAFALLARLTCGTFGRALRVDWSWLLMAAAVATMVLGNLLAIHQHNIKRMLAYSSVEHMGIMSVGVGLGGAGASAALFHAVNHSLTKGVLFPVAGNMVAV